MKILKTIFKITPFKLSVIIILIFLSISIVYDINPRFLPSISVLDQKSLDMKFKVRGIQLPKNNVVIVTGDEKTFTKFGQWPWDRRTVFAPLLEKLCRYNTKAIGLDIVWSETEKNLSSSAAKTIQQFLGPKQDEFNSALEKQTGDYALRKAIEFCGNQVVLGYAPSSEKEQGLETKEYEKRLKILLDQGQNSITSIIKGRAIFARGPFDPDSNLDYYHNAQTALLNIPEITPPQVAQGFFTNEGDSDGSYRHSLMFYRAGASFLPSLTLRMAQKAVSPNDTSPKLLVYPYLPEKNQTQDIKLEMITAAGPVAIPIGLTGKTIINYRGPNKTFPNVSIADVLDSSDTVEFEQVTLDGDYKKVKMMKSELFKDALILVGITAMALYDIRPRAFDPQASGVENHANILDNLMSSDFLNRPTTDLLLWLNLGLLVLSLIYAYLIVRFDAKWGAFVAAASISALLYIDQNFFFERGTVFTGYLQAIQFLTQYIVITVMKYMREENEKKFIRSAFDKYVSPAIVDSMLKDPSKLKLGGEKRELSVLFSDIRGFTELSEKVDVKALTQFLNEYLGAMTDILQKNLGTLDKYIGDAVMGFWGAPLELKNHSSLAVKTAVEMVLKLDELNALFQQKYGFTIDIGIGINSGPVSVGNFGSSKVFEYTVIGDNVNLSSRLESINKFYGTRIIISEATFENLTPGEVNYREIDTVKVKGKHKPVKIYELFPDNAAYAPLKNSLDDFNKGLAAYYNREWSVANEIFKKVLVVNPKDKVSLEMISRCEDYQKEPPVSDWDGSYEMKSK